MTTTATPGYYQRRYVNYARIHGKSPDDMVAFDQSRGGVGLWFSPWIMARWAEFNRLTQNAYKVGSGYSDEGHKAFDLWLESIPCAAIAEITE